MEENSSKSLGKMDVMLGFICALLFIDVVPSNTSCGVPVLVWWIIAAIVLYIPNSFITAELSATYPDRGGIYGWISRALGEKWAARTSYYYYVNNVLWIPSAFIWFSGVFSDVFLPSSNYVIEVAIGIVLTWVMVWIASKPLSESKWITNIAGISKLVAFGMVILAGLLFVLKGNAPANAITKSSLIPKFNDALIYLPVIIYCCTGTEVLSASAHEMKNPKKDIPKAIALAVILVVVCNILASLSTLLTIPLGNLDTVTGLTDVIRAGFSNNKLVVYLFGIILLYGIFTQVVSWTLAASFGASEAAKAGELPKLLAKENKASQPTGALIMSGIVATLEFVIYAFASANSSDLFFMLLAFSTIIYFIPYILMHVSYLILKKRDNTPRPIKVPMGKFLSVLCCVILIVSAMLLIWVPGVPIDLSYTLPVVGGFILVVIIGEIIINKCIKKCK